MLGEDLFEVRQWPVHKKLAYQEFMVVDQQLQQQAQHGDIGEMGGMGDLDLPSMGSMAGGNPQQIAKQAQQMSGQPMMGGQGGYSDQVHPHLRAKGYNTVYHIDNDSGDSADE